MTRLFLHFWNVSATFRIWQKKRISNIIVPFSSFGNWITFDPLRIRCLFYIWTTLFAHYGPHLRCCYYFASHKNMLFCFIWLDYITKNWLLHCFQFIPKGWTAALVRCLLSAIPIHSTAGLLTSFNQKSQNLSQKSQKKSDSSFRTYTHKTSITKYKIDIKLVRNIDIIQF